MTAQIAVLGANGQVGLETCLMLQIIGRAKVIGICRTRLGAAFLSRAGVECRIGSMDDPAAAREVLRGCQVVFDLTLPQGLVGEVGSRMRAGVSSAVAATEGSYVYASSYMALGMRKPGARLHRTLLSTTSYGALKRWTEAAVKAAGTKHHRPVYVLRLGQVHGEMQRVSKQIIKSMRSEPTLVPAGPSNTVFIYTIAEALLSIAAEKEIPGRYSLVSVPQWTWKDLHVYFARRCGMDPTIIEEPESGSGNPVRAGAVALGKMIGPVALRHRDLLTAYVLASHRALELKAKASHLRRAAAAEISEWAASRYFRPYDGAFTGVVPDLPLRSLSDSRATMEPYAEELRSLLAEIGLDSGGAMVPTLAKDVQR